MNTGDKITLNIIDMGMSCEGVARHGGFVVFVPFVCVGERVEAEITGVKKNFAVGRVVKLIERSPFRVPAPCKYYEVCGGCALQHMGYQQGLNVKRAGLTNTLKKAGVTSPAPNGAPPYLRGELLEVMKNNAGVKHPVTCGDTPLSERGIIEEFKTAGKPYHYRNKMAFAVKNMPYATLCMHEDGVKCFKVDDCLLGDENITKLIPVLNEFFKEHKVEAYDERTGQGVLRYVVMRYENGVLLVCLVVAGGGHPAADDLVKALEEYKNTNKNIKDFGLLVNFNTERGIILKGKSKCVCGQEFIEIEEPIKHSVGIDSFLQVNTDVQNLIYEDILSHIANEKVVNAYSGAGVLSALLAGRAKSVAGIEIMPEAHQNAEELKKRNEIKNLTNLCGDVKFLLEKHLDKGSTLVVDPPRSGLGSKITEIILKQMPAKILYVSCAPATLARDLALLKEKYIIESITPYDMFANTKHIETLTVLNTASTHPSPQADGLAHAGEIQKYTKNKKI